MRISLSKILRESAEEIGINIQTETPNVEDNKQDEMEAKDCCPNEEIDKAINESKITKLFESKVLTENYSLLLEADDNKSLVQKTVDFIKNLWNKIANFVIQLVRRAKLFLLEKFGKYKAILDNEKKITEGLDKIKDNTIKGKVMDLQSVDDFLDPNNSIYEFTKSIESEIGLDQFDVKVEKHFTHVQHKSTTTKLDKEELEEFDKIDIALIKRHIDDSIKSVMEMNHKEKITKEDIIEYVRNYKHHGESPKISDIGFTYKNIKEYIGGLNDFIKNETKIIDVIKKHNGTIGKLSGTFNRIMSAPTIKTEHVQNASRIVNKVSELHAYITKYAITFYQIKLDLARERALLAYKVGNAALKAVA